ITQKEVLDFVLFLKKDINTETDNDYLSKNTEIKQHETLFGITR
ncbi:MAG: hypothetical protein RI893_1385, partial [Pseudomonadota bacterium]